MRMMKWLVSSMLLAGAATGWALPIMVGTTDVGQVDTVLGQTNDLDLNPAGDCPNGSNPAAEVCWVNKVLAPNSVTYDESDKTDPQPYVETSEAGIIAFQLSAPTEYFLIKNASWWALFSNNPDTNWAVIDTTQLNAGFNLLTEGFQISHVAALGASVPEPGSLALLGAGLVGLGLLRRRRAVHG